MEDKSWKVVIHVNKDEVAKEVGEKKGEYISDSYMNDVVNALRERILDEFELFLGEAVNEVNENFKNGDFSGDLDGTGQLNNEIWRQVDEDEEDEDE